MTCPKVQMEGEIAHGPKQIAHVLGKLAEKHKPMSLQTSRRTAEVSLAGRMNAFKRIRMPLRSGFNCNNAVRKWSGCEDCP
jgi:hypothetical protein